MRPPRPIAPDPSLDRDVKQTADAYLAAARGLTDGSCTAIRMFVATNLFLRHLDIFENDRDPCPQFAEMFRQGASLLDAACDSGVCGGYFVGEGDGSHTGDNMFEDYVSGLFSDIWVGLTDDIYFDQSYELTKVRFEKSGVDPVRFFGGKTVLDAGCGSGKFSAAIGRFGAASVIGMDIGEKGLSFAREQAKKVEYGAKLDYRYGSLLDIPLEDGAVDVVWSNGVIHHTLDYEKCIEEFARVLKPDGELFLYVNGRFGLFELLLDTLRVGNQGIPRQLFQHYLHSLGINSGRKYLMMDCFYAPYEWKSANDVRSLLEKHGFTGINQLTRGVEFDSIEQITIGAPFADIKYGEGQLKYIARSA